METNKWIIPFSALIVLGLNFAWLPFPEYKFVYPFPYNKGQQISIQAYVDFIARDVSYIFICMVGAYLSQKYREYLFIVAVLCIGYLFDYCMTYNEPLRHYGVIPLSYSFYLAACLLLWFGYDYLNK